jgi:hypothetical protein
MFDIRDIQALYSNHAVEYTKHFRVRLNDRVVTFKDVRAAIQSGEIIEEDLKDIPNPSVLILGYDRNNEPLHIAVGVGDDKLYMVTVYVPTLDIWEADLKTRKRGV